MKTFATLFVLLFSITITNAQDNTLQTQSVTLDNLISFIAEHFPLDTINEEEDEDEDTLTEHNVTLLIETGNRNFSSEEEIILQQALKFLSKRLTEDDSVSIVVYSGTNGLLVDNTSAKNIKVLLHALSNVKSNIIEKHSDGIALAYKMAQENFNDTAINTVVMVRNPNASLNANSVARVETIEVAVDTAKPKQKNNLVLLTAITLLPELIAIIKN